MIRYVADRRLFMEHCAAYMKILPYLEKMRRLRTTTSIIYYDLACVAGKDAIKDESELLNHWFAELAKISQDKDFIAKTTGLTPEEINSM